MTIKKLLLSTAMIAGMSTSISYAEEFYAGISYSQYDLEEDILGSTANPASVNIKLGREIYSNFSVEGFIAFGVSEDSFSVDSFSSSFEIEVENGYGVALVAAYPFSNSFEIYGKFGYAAYSFDDTDSDPASTSGVLFGAGANYSLNDQHSLFVEYASLGDGEYDDFDINLDLSGLSFGYQINF